jgi:putative spermidine/putrescine transport system permease protein
MPLALAVLPALALLGVVWLAPLVSLGRRSLVLGQQYTLQRYTDVLADPVFRESLLLTLQISVAVTLICLALGYPLAYVLARLPRRWAAVLLVTVIVPFVSSVLIRSYAWITILADNGLVNELLTSSGVAERPLKLVFNDLGILIGMAQIQLPLLVLPLYSVMRGIDRSTVQAAQSLGATPATAFRRVFLPASLPGVAAGCSLVFVVSLGFFVTPALLGGPGTPMVAELISTEVTVLADFPDAAAQSIFLLIVVSLLMLLLRRQLGLTIEAASAQTPTPRRARRFGVHALQRPWTEALADRFDVALTGIRWPALVLVAGVAVLYLVLPLLVILPTAFSGAQSIAFPPPSLSTRWFSAYFSTKPYVDSTLMSVGLAAAGGVLATIFGTLAAYALVRARLPARSLVRLLLLSPLVLPQIVFAVAYFLAVAPLGLVGSPLPFVAVYAVLGLPYVVVVMTAVLRDFDRSLEHAAESLGARPLRVAASVTLPILRPALISGFVFAFLIAFDDVIFALFLSAPGVVTLPVRIYQDLQQQITPLIAAVSAIVLAGVLGVSALGGWAGRQSERRRRA